MAVRNVVKKILKEKDVVDLLNRPRIRIESKDLGTIPLLKHIRRLSFELPKKKGFGKISAVGIYARRYLNHEGDAELWYLESAKDSGYEGFSCVDDTARAIVLAISIYEKILRVKKENPDQKDAYNQATKELEELIEPWLNFLFYMQEKDGSITNFILDKNGTKNTYLPNSRDLKSGGIAWTSRALHAFAYAYKFFKKEKYKEAYIKSFVGNGEDMNYVAMLVVAALEILEVDKNFKVNDKKLEEYVISWCEKIMDHFDKFFHHTKKKNGELDGEVHTYAYHQLWAMARAGEYFQNEKYLRAVDETVCNVIEKNAVDGFYEVFPTKRGTTNLYGVSSIIVGLAELYSIVNSKKYKPLKNAEYYAYLAIIHAMWMYRENEAHAVMWFPSEGLCLDNTHIEDYGDVFAGTACGAESAIEGGFVQLALDKIRQKNSYLIDS